MTDVPVPSPAAGTGGRPATPAAGGLAPLSRRRLTLALSFEWVARGASLLMGIAVMALLSRHLGPARFGDLSLAFTLVVIAQIAADSGFKQAAIRAASLDPAGRGRIAATYVTVRGALGVALFALVSVCGLVLARDAEARVAVVLVALTLATGFLVSAGFLLHVRVRNELFAATVVAQGALWLIVVAAGVHLGASLVWLAAGYLIVALGHAVWTFLLARRLVPFRPGLDPGQARALARAALPLAAGGLAAVLASRVDAVLVYAVIDAEAGAFYSAAYRVVDQLQLLPAALVAMVAPLLTAWQATDRPRFAAAVSRLLRYVLVITVPTALAVGLLAGHITELLYGEGFAASGRLLAVLAASFVFLSLNLLFATALVALGHARFYAGAALGGLAVNLAANLVLLPALGALAGAAVSIATQAGLAAVLFCHLRRRGVALDARPLLGVGLASAAFLAAALPLAPGAPLAGVAIGLGAYAACCLATGVVRGGEIRSMLSRAELARV